MFDLTGKRRARHRRLRRDRRGDRQGAARARRDRRDLGHQQGEARCSRRRARQPRLRASLRPPRPRGGGQARRRGGEGARPGRHPRQQCRHHPRQSLHAHEGRGVGRRHRRQPHLGIRADPHDPAQHDAPPLRAHRQYRLDLGRARQSGPAELRGVQGRAGRHDQVARPGGVSPRHHRQLHRARASSRPP